MNTTDMLIDLADRTRVAAEALRGALTPELLNAHPHHDNSIAWLLWHAAREIDEQLTDLSGQQSVWIAEGFAERFNLPVAPHEHGYGHTPEQARAIVVQDPALLIEHLNAVVEAQIAFLAGLDAGELSRVVDDSHTPPVDLATRTISMSCDALEHVAQATYIAGMGPGAFERVGG